MLSRISGLHQILVLVSKVRLLGEQQCTLSIKAITLDLYSCDLSSILGGCSVFKTITGYSSVGRTLALIVRGREFKSHNPDN